jgi:hypothetical protein
MIPENKILEYHTILARADWHSVHGTDHAAIQSVERAQMYRDQLLKDFPIEIHTIVSLWNLARSR